MSRADNRNSLRDKLGDLLPQELDTNFQLDRWLDNYHDQVDVCAEKFAEYSRNRRALGYEGESALDYFYDRADVRRFHRTFNVSRVTGDWVNDADNGLVFAEMGIGDPNAVCENLLNSNAALAEFSIGEYLRIFFGYCEYFQRLIIRQEARTNRRSHGICIFDMAPMNMMHYANVYAPINRLLQSRVNIWTSYYGEMLKHIIIVHPPRLIGAFFKLLSMLLPGHIAKRFIIAKNTPYDMEHIISRAAIPHHYGGERQEELYYRVENVEKDCNNNEPTYNSTLTKENQRTVVRKEMQDFNL